MSDYEINLGNNDIEREQDAMSKSSEEPLGNVSDYVAEPAGYNGEKRKGILIFDANFESGNLGRVDLINDFEYDLFVRPDTCNARFRVWFNFTVKNVSAYQRVIFNIVNFSKTKSLYREGMSPVVKSSSRPKWQRIAAKNVFYYRCPDHRKNYVMSFAFCFDKDEDMYQFAYSYPYTYTRLQKYLNQLQRRGMDYFQRKQLCLSVQQRKVDLLTITSKGNGGNQRKRVVFFTARVHPGETPASYVCQGIIDFLVSQHPMAKVLRDYIIFKIIPMLNPDGVVLGNYRSSLMGFDLNRHWNEPTVWAHPSISAAKDVIMALDENRNVDLDFFIDIHAHSTLNNSFMYGNIYDNEDRFERQMAFPRLLYGNADDFSMSNTSFNRDALKAGTGRRFLGNALNPRAHCYTLEVSFASYITGYGQVNTPYTEEAYHRLGRNVARTFLDYYKLDPLVLDVRLKQSYAARGKQSSEDESCSSLEHDKGKIHNDVPTFNRNSSDSSVDSNGLTSLRLTHRKTK
ncbi:Cytosolic carboxypeptidase 6 [Paramuricea clavata]|nr:Cytosolic carboxypeptidase 6 [Paramuricea clavata]